MSVPISHVPLSPMHLQAHFKAHKCHCTHLTDHRIKAWSLEGSQEITTNLPRSWGIKWRKVFAAKSHIHWGALSALSPRKGLRAKPTQYISSMQYIKNVYANINRASRHSFIIWSETQQPFPHHTPLIPVFFCFCFFLPVAEGNS